jgi:sodium--glutamate symport carrier gltS
MTGDPILIPDFETATLGLLVFLLGARITRNIRILRDFNIPEPVTGGLLAALIALCVVSLTGRPIVFGMAIRDYLLVLFFSGIGLNARLRDVVAGGRPLAILLGLTVALISLLPYMIFKGLADRAMGRMESVIAAAQTGLPKRPAPAAESLQSSVGA